ncbi:HK97 family phage prohead protease [Rhodosalinus sp.]|uniref:HK97 family phage prohead protease n=1 Tax=Rhodosalinus sp. TaxID=2047741 RepID=UPI003565DF81
MELERKFAGAEVALDGAARIEGYASLFGAPDQGGDAVAPGAFAGALGRGRAVRMLWQHDPAQPIGVWEEVREDARGLFVRGRLLTEVARGREAAALLKAGAIEGLSIGYRTVSAERRGTGRLLTGVDLWEVSLVTFPMLPEARAQAKADPGAEALRALADGFQAARRALRG